MFRCLALSKGTPLIAEKVDQDVRAMLPITDWMRRHADRRNPEAFINTNPEYFASEIAAAITALMEGEGDSFHPRGVV